jgi:aspartyl-tRNA synthetase
MSGQQTTGAPGQRSEWKRTHTCGELRRQHVGASVVLAGWINRRRDHGSVTFLNLRDRYGLTQVVVDSDDVLGEGALGSECVVRVRGAVRARPDDMINPDMPTGEIEVVAEEVLVETQARTTPFPIDAPQEPSEELKFRYRYLELRRPSLQRSMRVRHRAVLAARQALDEENFLEIETPLLIKTTPEGARDFVVPSRIHPGRFYALPQSPQIYKQILMVAGFDRYFQMARCLRDEDLRADRQPEFTQIDLEMSFVDPEDVFRVTEKMLCAMCAAAGHPVPETPFPRMTYDEALERYGIDKPDTRFGIPLHDVGELLGESDFKAFRSVLDAGGRVRALCASGGAALSRKNIDALTEVAQRAGAKGLAWVKLDDGGATGGIAKFLSASEVGALRQRLAAADGDLLAFVADEPVRSAQALGQVRLALAEVLEVPRQEGLHFSWVYRFPLFERDASSPSGWAPAHHMFTMPEPGCEERIESDPASVTGQLYDLVCNGMELGSGSIRVHKPELQRRIMRQVGFSDAEIDEKFGFLLESFEYGAPPHGGIALGLDRIVMLLVGADSLRDTIAFPKTARATSPMDGSPSRISPQQLEELGLQLRPRSSHDADPSSST